jgi:hypothetical protein
MSSPFLNSLVPTRLSMVQAIANVPVVKKAARDSSRGVRDAPWVR